MIRYAASDAMHDGKTQADNRCVDDVRISKVGEESIDDLVKICRESFPDYIWWYGPRFVARLWWSFMLSAPSAEAYMMYSNKKPIGILLIVSDMKSFTIYEKGRSSRKKLLCSLRYLGFFMHPRLAITTIRNFIKRSAHHQHVKWQCKLDLESVAWGVLQAISPEYRRIGLARKFLRFAEERGLELQKRTFIASVEPDNISIMNLLRSFGYNEIGRRGRELIYGKFRRD
jgi:hypothetical protein